MSTHRRVEVLCVACAIVACLVCALSYVLGSAAGQDVDSGHQMGYEQTLFDTAKVHTIDIVMDDWDSFIQTCENEEYASCTVVVDGESFKNVAIRAKGNTSLSNVSQLDSERYSFKIEFDHYESSRSYHGLDKLSLNNIIQDNTFMKDYLTYRMMGAFGVDSPLASYAYITVNGEDWGLYLAVESVEDSFLERIYGTNKGDLYKPDSTGFGGGRGNGREFDMDEFMNEQEAEGEEGNSSEANTESNDTSGTEETPSSDDSQSNRPRRLDDQSSNGQAVSGDQATGGDQMIGGGPGRGPRGEGPGGGGPGGGMGSSDVKLQYVDDDPSSYQNIFDNAKTDVTSADKTRLIESLRKLSEGEDLENVLDMDEVLRYFVVHDYVCNGDSYTGSMIHNYYLRESEGKLSMIPWDYNLAFGGFTGGDATTLVNAPIDDPTSLSSGFGGGGGLPTDGGEADGKSREPANSEKSKDGQAAEEQTTARGDDSSTSQNTDAPQVPDGMPTPDDGQMPQMPGGMEMPNAAPSLPSGQGTPADSDSSDSDSRPMVDWIFLDEAYTQAYHELYQQFLDDVDVQSLISETQELIAPYVERDPTKFCTYEEFKTGVEVLREFCALRTNSVQGQLDGTIPSTEEGQQEDSSALVDASGLTISDMGSMGNAGGGPQPGGSRQSERDSGGDDADPTTTDGSDSSATDDFKRPDDGSGQTNDANQTHEADQSNGFGSMRPGSFSAPDDDDRPSAADPLTGWIALVASVALLAVGMGFSLIFRRP